jgi:uncharacterized RDD family membrane protein YckC
MENNPYAAPGAVVADSQAFDAYDLDARKASREQRFGAAFIDGIVIGIGTVPITFYLMQLAQSDRRLPFVVSPTLMAVGFVALAIVCVVNYLWLKSNGQTIGKRALGIKTVRKDGSPVTVPRVFFLRYLPITLVGLIPFIGGIVALVDALIIFGSEKRCLHDLIADTIVIEA